MGALNFYWSRFQTKVIAQLSIKVWAFGLVGLVLILGSGYAAQLDLLRFPATVSSQLALMQVAVILLSGTVAGLLPILLTSKQATAYLFIVVLGTYAFGAVYAAQLIL